MQCFVLPYGGSGFVLDLLVLYGVPFLLDDQSPWKGQRLEHQPLNMYFSLIGMFGSFGVAVYNARRCHNSWPLVVASVWKGSHVSMFNFIGFACNYKSSGKSFDRIYLGWLQLSYTGISIAGTVGLSRIARDGWGDSNMKIGTIRMLVSHYQSLQSSNSMLHLHCCFSCCPHWRVAFFRTR
jgi:hypothetical protein